MTIASGMPTRTSAHSTCVSDAPEARITVYSEFATSCDKANSVPISAAIGNSSYIRDGSCSATNSNAALSRVAVAAHVAELVDEVEEREQHDQRGEDQQ